MRPGGDVVPLAFAAFVPDESALRVNLRVDAPAAAAAFEGPVEGLDGNHTVHGAVEARVNVRDARERRVSDVREAQGAHGTHGTLLRRMRVAARRRERRGVPSIFLRLRLGRIFVVFVVQLRHGQRHRFVVVVVVIERIPAGGLVVAAVAVGLRRAPEALREGPLLADPAEGRHPSGGSLPRTRAGVGAVRERRLHGRVAAAIRVHAACHARAPTTARAPASLTRVGLSELILNLSGMRVVDSV